MRVGDIKLKNHIGDCVELEFLAMNVEVKESAKGNYINLDMCNKEHKVNAKIFGVTQEQIDSVKSGHTYKALVNVNKYDKAPGGFSCVINSISNLDVPQREFIDWSETLEQSKEYVVGIIKEVQDSVYGKIACAILKDKWQEFWVWSAAKGQHHNQLGGLVSHEAEVVMISDKLYDMYTGIYGKDFLDRNLLLCSALLHDVDKINELDVDVKTGATEYTTRASLSTHIMDIGIDIELKARELGIEDKEAILLLQHCVAAHHGKLEWGSPITAAVPEAYILHMADMISAEMFRYNRDLSTMDVGESISKWSNGGYVNVYKKENR